MKSVPHCKFSDFQNKATFKHPSSIKNEFSDIPNYRLTSKAFDARHLDQFLVRVNVSDSNNFNSSQVRIQLDNQKNKEQTELIDDEDMVIQRVEVDREKIQSILTPKTASLKPILIQQSKIKPSATGKLNSYKTQ